MSLPNIVTTDALLRPQSTSILQVLPRTPPESVMYGAPSLKRQQEWKQGSRDKATACLGYGRPVRLGKSHA